MNPRNDDGNLLRDIASAIDELGGSLDHVDEERHVIEALVPAAELETLKMIDGVSYIRTHGHFVTAA